ncbi:MAG: MBL fold metallo-hydrolase [Calditrichia bacterium]
MQQPKPQRIELPTVFGMKTVNSWLLPGTEPVLVDCGENSHASMTAIEKGLGGHGMKVEDISHLLITHAHVDHIGMAGRLAKRSGATVHVSSILLDWALRPQTMWKKRADAYVDALETYAPDEADSYQKVFRNMLDIFAASWSMIDSDQVSVFEPAAPLAIGGFDWDVIPAPGHCGNQTVFYHSASKTMLSADMLLKVTPTPVIGESTSDSSKPVIMEMLESYEFFSAMDIDHTFPGHYQAFGNPQKYISEQVQRIHGRKEACFERIKSAKPTFIELLNSMYENRVSPPAFSMLIGYVQLLEREQRIQAVRRGARFQLEPC